MKLKKLLVAGVAIATLAGTTLGAAAAPLGEASSVTLKDIFDAEYYASQYPDLQEAFGDDEEMLYQHFITYGLKEGRNMNPILDVVAYREAYGDLEEAFGDDWDKYVEHFFTYGANEYRDEGVLFNPIQYADSYSDITEAYGDDLAAIARHYIIFGMKEEREEGTSKGYESISALREAERKQKEYIQAASAPANPAPTETPDTPANPAPTETPDTPVNPAPTETPDTPVNPAPTETPDTPVNPAPTETPDTPTVPDTPETPDDGRSEEIYNAMIALKTEYPDGTPWTDENRSYVWHAIPNVNMTGTGCAAFAFILSDAAFGTEAPATKVTDVSTVRVGDIVRIYNDTHFVVVLNIAENGDVTVAEGNFNSSVYWGRVIEKAEFEENFDYLYTRY